MRNTTHEALPQPRRERGSGHLASALTFYVTRAQRARILRILGQLSDDRARALLIALSEIEAGEGVCP